MNRATTVALAPASAIYGLAIKARSFLYSNKILTTHKLSVPVISVGNLTTGGTGKTPLVARIAKYLASKDRKVCILSRGYGRKAENTRVLVSNGTEILADALMAGDEPLLLGEELLGSAAVISDANRIGAANWAMENLKSDVFLLDDGFQHLRIYRDVDIVTIDATSPWGNGSLIPGGPLREPITALSRADCVIITRSEASDRDLEDQISRTTQARILISTMVTNAIMPLAHGAEALEKMVHHAPIGAFCAIGNQQAFFSQLQSEDFQVAYTQAFHDHHVYSQRDIDRIVDAAKAHGAELLVTTGKDEVKLRSLKFELPCFVLKIGIEVQDEQKLLDLLDARLRARQD